MITHPQNRVAPGGILISIVGFISFASTTRTRVPGPAAGGRVPGGPCGRRQGVSITLDPQKGMSRTPWFAKNTFLVENAYALGWPVVSCQLEVGGASS